MKFIILLLLAGLTSCALVKKDFTDNPISINSDQMTGYTWVNSNWANHYCGTSNGYAVPYLGLKGKEKWVVLNTKSIARNALHFSQIRVRCGNNRVKVIERKPFEDWKKDFNTSCGQYSCSTSETSRVVIKDDIAKEILSCTKPLKFRISGTTTYVEIDYNPEKNPNYYRGLSDLKSYYFNK